MWLQDARCIEPVRIERQWWEEVISQYQEPFLVPYFVIKMPNNVD